ncbi:uncharacterized protein LOC143880434 isoform X4 [Tasmannia lanceolata]|uniref:uncharacterized protein LOC143880434 isoform X4 n=1 Tax=Tasmannia lanceolata TaxID=3420 RepID=UPI00406449C4
MEASAGRVGPLPMPTSQSARKEWRAVSEHSVRNSVTEQELERVKLGQSDERTIYEVNQGMQPLHADFCAITIDGGMDNDILQQRLHSVSSQREELQQMEIELRAQVIVRSEIVELQKSFDSQIKEHVNAAIKLKEQLQEREQCIHELEIKMEEKDRELRAIKIDNEAAWAKEDLLREQNKELATFQREHDNAEAERAQHLKQIHDLQEHINEKERRFLELEEQHRVAQETVLYRDEQLREAQAWIARVQERDALLQAEFRERDEHFNQIWLGFQRQFAEMERHHMQTIQHLQLELGEARERSGIYNDDSRSAHANSKDVSPYVQNKGNQFNVNEGGTLNTNSGILPNGNIDKVPAFVSDYNAPTKTDHASGVPLLPSSILGMGAFIPTGQVPALHPFVTHQQGVPQSVPPANSHVPQIHVGHFQSVPSISSHQHWQNQQVVPESSQISNQNQYQHSQIEQSQNQYQHAQIEQSLLKSDVHYDYEISGDGRVAHSEYLEGHINPQQISAPIIPTSSEELEVLESNDKRYLVSHESHQNVQESSSQFQETSRLGTPEENSEPKEGDDENTFGVITNLQEEPLVLTRQQQWSDAQNHQASSTDATDCSGSALNLRDVPLSTGRSSSSMIPTKTQEVTVLDERSLLACIVRAIPAGSGGRIRISTTLPNRLGKMLAPLHWHDYKKEYGKLDDFVSHHPELFVIEGDYIHLREGAQGIISATTAVAKVAAAAAVSTPYSSSLPSVAVTPVAHSHRIKKVPSIDPGPKKTTNVVNSPADECEKPSQVPVMQGQHSNGVSFNIVQGFSNVKILSKSKDQQELNGLSKMRPGQSSVHMTFGNGANHVRTGLANSQNNGSTDGKHGLNFGGKAQGRGTGGGLTARR